MDLRVDLILRVEQDHSMMSATTQQARCGEHWQCACGETYKGDGAIKKGLRHCATEVLSALDEASRVA